MKLLPLFLLSFFSAILSAQTVGQYELRKRGASGFTSYGVTLSDGQVIGQTAGVPAAITLSGGAAAPEWGDITGTLADQTDLINALNAKLATATAASTYATIAHNQAWSTITSTPTTLSGYGITDAITAAVAASTYAPIAHNQAWSTITSTPTTLSGYGITDAITAAVAASTYAPIAHNQAWSTITSTPTTLSGYGITDAITAALAAATYQPLSANLTTFSGIAPSANVQSLLAAADYSAIRSLLSLGTAALVNTGTGSGNVLLLGTGGLLSAPAAIKGIGNLTIAESGQPTWTSVLAAAYLYFSNVQGSGFDVEINAGTPTANRQIVAPDASGTIITTGNLSAITATGTITSGTWQGSVIAPAYLGTGSDITTKFLRGDGTWQTLAGGGDALVASPLSQFAATTSSQLAGVISDETGSGALVFANSPTLVTPALGTPASGNLSNCTMEAEIQVACSDETTALTAGTGKVTFRMPYAMTLLAVSASVTTAPTGSTLIVDINENGSSILSTKLSVDASEKTSNTAATIAVISDAALAEDAEITIDLDQVGSTIAGTGLKVTLIGTR